MLIIKERLMADIHITIVVKDDLNYTKDCHYIDSKETVTPRPLIGQESTMSLDLL